MSARAKRILAVVGLLAGGLIALAWLTQRERATAAPAEDAPREGSSSAPLPGEALRARPADPAQPSLAWSAPGTDAEEIRAKVEEALSFTLLFSHKHASRHAQFRRLLGFIESAAGPDEAGQALAACRVEYEPQFETSCDAGITVVLQRDPESGEGRAVHAQAHVADDVEQACRLWAACVVSTWPGRSLARLSEITRGDMLAVRAPMLSGGFHELPSEEYGPFYDKICEQFELSLESEGIAPEIYQGLSTEDQAKVDAARAKQRDIMEVRLRDCQAVRERYALRESGP